MTKVHSGLGLFLGALLCQQSLFMLFSGSPANAAATRFSASQVSTKQLLSQSITDYEFSDGEWTVKVRKVDGELRYEGSNINQSKGIRITGGKKSKKNGRFVYTWKNKNISYIVIWNPNDPSFARLQVTESGRLILNKLLNTTEKAQ
jgi:hypothetical protein